jgi:hypothetical protein
MMKSDIDRRRDSGRLAAGDLVFVAPVATAANTPLLRRLAILPPLGYLLFWATGILDNQLGGLLGTRSATGLGERLMAAAFTAWLVAVAVTVRRSPAREVAA